MFGEAFLSDRILSELGLRNVAPYQIDGFLGFYGGF